MSETLTQKTVVVGAGPVGALAALYAAQRGHDVEVYELRSDLRLPSTVPLNFTKSISLSLSERGINAIKASGKPDLLETIISETLPMRGRMIHGKSVSGEFYQQSQDYDIHGRTNYATNRSGFNKVVLDELESLPNVKLFFNHKLTGADIRRKKAWFEVSGAKEKVLGSRDREIETTFDFIIGADGAHSATRYHLMKYTRMDYQQEYIDTLWCEFTILAKDHSEDDPESRFAISPNHLHIWPGHEFMFIAIPNFDGSFTCTLFLPSTHFASLESNPHALPTFFNTHFPGVTALINPTALISSFIQNPHLPIISIKCSPHHFSDAAVIVGDAAHAMVPFYGQGMNAGLEDVRVLFSMIDKHVLPTANHQSRTAQRAKALAEYSATRTEDAYAINDLSLQNYTEMRASVTSPTYRARKWLEEKLSVYVPSLGWQTKYSRVSFGNERYGEVIRKSEQQGRQLVIALVGVLASPVVIGALVALQRWRGSTRGAFKWSLLFGWKST